MNLFIIGIRFQESGKVYHFDASSDRDLRVGDFVIVDTARGRQLGQVTHLVNNPPPPSEGTWKPIHRKATPQDLVLRQSWQQKEQEAVLTCRAKAKSLMLDLVKIITAEYSFDGTRLTFFYSLEAEEKIDLKVLRKTMQRLYPHSQIDLHQVGPRDVAKMLGGMGACGLENRCCTMFLTEFCPVSIKMAKDQDISLTPSEITGMCGRLRCCLVYEYEHYAEARKYLPKKNKTVMTPHGEGKVVDILALKQTVIVEYENGIQREFTSAELHLGEGNGSSNAKLDEFRASGFVQDGDPVVDDEAAS